MTVAIRRINIGQDPGEPSLLDVLPPDRYTILPNTAGCYTADDAVRTCRLARELLDGHALVKLEVLGDQRTLFPDVRADAGGRRNPGEGRLPASWSTRSDDPILAKRLEQIGCVAVMPLAPRSARAWASRIRYNLLEIIENAEGADHRRRRRRHRLGCGDRDGAGLRWRADEYRHRRRAAIRCGWRGR